MSALAFSYPQDVGSVTQNKTMHLITASVDTRIRMFDLVEGTSTSGGGAKPEAVLEGHVSVPRGLDVSWDGRWLVSGGRDSVVDLGSLFEVSFYQGEEEQSKKADSGENYSNFGTRRCFGLDDQFRSKTDLSVLHRRREGHQYNLGWESRTSGTKIRGRSTCIAELEEQRQIVDVL
jgi:U3 small nucleolar RNA-associated protein 13